MHSCTRLPACRHKGRQTDAYTCVVLCRGCAIHDRASWQPDARPGAGRSDRRQDDGEPTVDTIRQLASNQRRQPSDKAPPVSTSASSRGGRSGIGEFEKLSTRVWRAFLSDLSSARTWQPGSSRCCTPAKWQRPSDRGRYRTGRQTWSVVKRVDSLSNSCGAAQCHDGVALICRPSAGSIVPDSSGHLESAWLKDGRHRLEPAVGGRDEIAVEACSNPRHRDTPSSHSGRVTQDPTDVGSVICESDASSASSSTGRDDEINRTRRRFRATIARAKEYQCPHARLHFKDVTESSSLFRLLHVFLLIFSLCLGALASSSPSAQFHSGNRIPTLTRSTDMTSRLMSHRSLSDTARLRAMTPAYLFQMHSRHSREWFDFAQFYTSDRTAEDTVAMRQVKKRRRRHIVGEHEEAEGVNRLGMITAIRHHRLMGEHVTFCTFTCPVEIEISPMYTLYVLDQITQAHLYSQFVSQVQELLVHTVFQTI
ncbi:unnamed protein product [Protopolystoma xenopodis]|uniref:Uncharacterized protein n=1 Tax=Protopolystoma xenopodis TaxID=117903 RepID=A0A448XS64_9PLAT|nr:unnamed protein product [Protopolystoma xenopodis]